MSEEMTLSGLAEDTQTNYLQAVERLSKFYNKSPEQLIEEQVRAYFLHL